MRSFASKISTRDAILDATDRLLARSGYKKMTIDSLAREVGIGKGSVYLHFASKEAIALSHIDRIIDRLKKRLVEIGATSTDIETRLAEMLSERVLFRFDSVQHYSRSLDELLSRVRTKLLEHRVRHFEEEARIIAGVVEEGQKNGTLANGDPIDLARSLVTATNSLLPYNLSVLELGKRSDIAEQVRKMSNILIKGLSV